MGWWTLDEAGPAYLDRALGDTGTGSNTAAVPGGGINGGAARFDGATSFISVPDASGVNFGSGNFSVDLWLRTSVNGVNTGVWTILDKRQSGQSAPAALTGYHVYLYNGRLGIQLADFGYDNYVSNLFVADGLWHHVAVTVDRTTQAGIRFYADGVQGSVTGDPRTHQGSLTNTVPLRIGTRSAALSGAYWPGDLDEIELFNRVLAPSEVAAIAKAFKNGKCKCAELKVVPRAWWRFDDPAGATTALDDGGDPQGPFDAALVGAQTNASGRVRRGLEFLGGVSAVGVANDAPLAISFGSGAPGGFSIDAWVKTTAPSGPLVTALTTDPLDRGANGYELRYSSGLLSFRLQAIDTNFVITGLEVSCSSASHCPVIDNDAWHLVGVTLAWGPGGSSATATLFVDGKAYDTVTATTPLLGIAGGTFRIGAHVRTGRLPDDTYFTGALDEVELFDRALTEADFASIFAAQGAGKCQPCDLTPRAVISCGKATTPECPGGLFCDLFPICGAGTAGGVCAVRPHACSPLSAPVCGCDRKTYANSCAAAARGVSVSHAGAC
ncbi:MAG TPA: LamG-like jellyroll fold domain-containing protein [Thermoanaerobaculia bacterium]|nr:LamG-like jellyroll fold domain-containing protein [Thermoanaerobaculia bacterium]